MWFGERGAHLPRADWLHLPGFPQCPGTLRAFSRCFTTFAVSTPLAMLAASAPLLTTLAVSAALVATASKFPRRSYRLYKINKVLQLPSKEVCGARAPILSESGSSSRPRVAIVYQRFLCFFQQGNWCLFVGVRVMVRVFVDAPTLSWLHLTVLVRLMNAAIPI